MTFQTYLNMANELAKKNPESLKLEVVSSSDDEGNSFTPVLFKPSAGLFNKDNRDFILEGEFKEMDLPDDTKPNAVCIN